jgi:hypothetical protein
MVMIFTVMWIANLAAMVFGAHCSNTCVCLPGQACWPTTKDWDAFNETVGGNLQIITPLGQACHDPTFNASECEAINLQYGNSSWKTDQISALYFIHR